MLVFHAYVACFLVSGLFEHLESYPCTGLLNPLSSSTLPIGVKFGIQSEDQSDHSISMIRHTQTSDVRICK